ncbi:MoaD/ThiS family protein [Sulfolobus acidocaldarius]|uniref:Conserved Archaeal protein n=4 Tax=Sulfolobus acidocaldarius TaxID=2285 RepID=Q4JAX6_SULAC|nr:MoaD/ThiS family protein [Sulfolobus acidocaldarius]AAY80053.1 conserved Archaeal protein [Sulfolobus acidocaldarius DSM 639]AGE70624.1 hypothetical protein SacN8_03235 [Sulfolobus acidocaldarius N8]AGE72897.1 hypothetical protein SacRon12I_03225 [Sulfolobus acidocaldarius Ron12/I]ALU29024.1 ubiquitin [Sulfolobus acidocaldarius]ALU31751.1 ubiquitin [Sulfolobus acidocaldarius]
MSVKIRLKGPLATRLGRDEFVISLKADNLLDILKELDKEEKLLINGNKIRSGYILLINGIDYRLLNGKLKDGDVVDILPINHGG